MSTIELTQIIACLTDALEDAEKFDSGNDTAGKRLRASAQEAKTRLHQFRLNIQQERNTRKGK